jgi:hypothetical protein
METCRKRVRFAEDVKGSCDDEPRTPSTLLDESFSTLHSTHPPSACQKRRRYKEGEEDKDDESSENEHREMEEGECLEEDGKEDGKDDGKEDGECSDDDWTSCDEDDYFLD